MKNIHEILKELGIEIPADKKADFDTAVNENYKTVAEVDKIRTARDTYKQSLEDAQKALKSFEGVNVDELKGEIVKLTNDLAAKDAEHQQKLDDMDFNSTVDSAIKAKGAKNVKAVRALLDLETLKASKNREGDINAALDKVAADEAYLFDAADPKGGGTPNFTGMQPGNPGGNTPPANVDTFATRLAEARKNGDTAAAVAIKREAAENNVFLM